MKREEFESDKFIFPRGDWRCWICLCDLLNLEVFAETEKEVLLICEPCRRRNLIMVENGLSDF